VFIASPAASQDGKALVAETRAPLAKRRNSKYQPLVMLENQPCHIRHPVEKKLSECAMGLEWNRRFP
jgi:hypothetical protein